MTHFVLLVPFWKSLLYSSSHYVCECSQFTPTHNSPPPPSPSAVAMETGLCQVAPQALWFTLTSSGWFTRPRDPGSAGQGATGQNRPLVCYHPPSLPPPTPQPPHTVWSLLRCDACLFLPHAPPLLKVSLMVWSVGYIGQCSWVARMTSSHTLIHTHTHEHTHLFSSWLSEEQAANYSSP